MKYIDLVLCRDPSNGVVLYQAPKFSMLKPEDEVCVFDCRCNEKIVTVIDAISIDKESDEFNFIMKLNGMKEPFKILGKVDFSKFGYDEQKDGDANDQK